jgi:transposase, IS5 family
VTGLLLAPAVLFRLAEAGDIALSAVGEDAIAPLVIGAHLLVRRIGVAVALIRKRDATDASVHDSQKLDDVLDLSNTGQEVWADSAYRSVQIEVGLKEKGLQSRIHRRAARNRPLSERQKSANTTRSKVRARVEHVFGHQQSSMGGKIVRTIGIVRARFKIGMMNLGYNIRRLVQLERVAAAPA